MINNSFLSKWDKPTKYIFLLGLIALFINICLFSYQYAIGPEGHLDWFITSETEAVESPIVGFQKLFHNHTISGTKYIMYEKFGANLEPVSTNASLIFLSFILLAFNLAFIAITNLKKQPFFIGGMVILFLFIAVLRIGELEVFGTNPTLNVAPIILIYGVLGYWFYDRKNKISTISKFGISSLVTILLAIIIGSLSKLPHPALHITNAGHLPLGIAALLFIVIIAFDILNGFFYLATNSKSVSPKSNLINFVMISTLYLGSLVLIFLQRIDFIDWDLKLFDPYYLLAISSVIGLWSHRKRALRFQKLIPYKAGSSFIYLALGIICFSTFYYAFATFNDGFVMVYKDAVLYSHLFIGITYFFYILINFYPQIKKNLPAYRFEYDPTFLRLSFVRIAGCLLWLVVVQRTGQHPINQWSSANDSLWGDLYKKQAQSYLNTGQLKKAEVNFNFAETYFRNAYGRFIQNHKAAYNLSRIYTDQYEREYESSDLQEAIKFYKVMIQCDFATPQSFVNYANFVWVHTHSGSDQRDILQKGLAKNPNNGYLLNNYALTFRDLPVFIDSTEILLKKALDKTEIDFVPATNLLAFNIQYGSGSNSNALGEHKDYLPIMLNLEASKNPNLSSDKQPLDQSVLEDSVLSNEEFFYLNNYILSNIQSLDPKVIDLKKFINHAENSNFHQELIELNAHFQLNKGNKFKGKHDLLYLAEAATETSKPDYHKLIGLYLLKEDDLKNAAYWYEKAHEVEKFRFKMDAQLYLGMIEGRLGNKDIAFQLLEGIVMNDTINNFPTARSMYTALKAELSGELNFTNDQERIWHLLFNANTFDSPQAYILSTIEDPDLKAQTIAEIIPTLVNNNRISDAENLLEYVPVDAKKEKSKLDLNYAQLRILEAKGESKRILEFLKSPELAESKMNYIPHFKAVSFANLNEKNSATVEYKKALLSSSFDEETLFKGIRFLTDSTNEEEFTYNTILEASLSSPESILINQLYVYVSTYNLDIQLAESVLNDLEEKMDPMEFKSFNDQIETLKFKRFEEEGIDLKNTTQDEDLY